MRLGTLPSADDVRCPACRSIAWRRLGERVIEEPPESGLNGGLKHLLANEDGPWDWTCETCGYAVKAGSRLDHQVSGVQRRPRIWRDALAALGLRDGLGARNPNGVASSPRTDTPTSAGRGARHYTTAQVASAVVGVGLVVVVAALLLLLRAPGEQPQPRPAAGCVGQNDLEQLGRQTRGASLAGRCVELDGVEVQAVTGDVTFWVGRSETQRTFVVLNEVKQGETPVRVREGQRLGIKGTLQPTPIKGVDVTASDRAALAQEVVYIHAESVRIQGQ